MRKTYFDAAIKFEPYSALYDAGATPESVKEAIVALLHPYVADESKLRELAVSDLAVDAVCVGRLSSNPTWKAILDRCFDIRTCAINTNRKLAFEVMGYFQPAIMSAQGSFVNLVVFEVPKNGLSMDEFAFELIRTIGALIESNLRPYIKELYCMLMIVSGQTPNLASISAEEFGQTCEKFEKLLNDNSLLTPAPWGVRINQWRNVAQHHSYEVCGDRIIATYGKSIPPKKTTLARSELLALAHELVQRLGALKSSRTITAVNFIDELKAYLPSVEPTAYSHATALAASFATQGFRLLDLQVSESQATAVIEDMAPSEDNKRPIHCSQFVGTIASRFPGTSVEVRYVVNGRCAWTFSASADQLDRIMELPDPLVELANIVTFKNEP